uniref:Uncharacterized protein n=1 Tax=Balamuthia mandrillaris TaxID=66527 RepID=A0A0K1HRR8_9EUKA|nr:hypothetical protein [Balamuthia mandrillaris]AKT94893.1 hypothetical protein [Balamuthia mandrillaris]
MRFSDRPVFLTWCRCRSRVFYWYQMLVNYLVTVYFICQLHPTTVYCWNPEDTIETVGTWCFWTFMIVGIGYWAYEHYSGKFDEDKDKKKKDKKKDDGGNSGGGGISISTEGKNVVSSAVKNLKGSGSDSFSVRGFVNNPRFQLLIKVLFDMRLVVFLGCFLWQLWPQPAYCSEGNGGTIGWCIYWTVFVIGLSWGCRYLLREHQREIEEEEKRRAAFEQAQDYKVSADVTDEELALFCQSKRFVFPENPVIYEPNIIEPLPYIVIYVNKALDIVIAFVGSCWDNPSTCLFFTWNFLLWSFFLIDYVMPYFLLAYIKYLIYKYDWLPGFYPWLNNWYANIWWWQEFLAGKCVLGSLYFFCAHLLFLYCYYFPG